METSAEPRRPNLRGPDDLLPREEIVEAAVRLLDELADDQALSLRAVARALSVPPASLHLTFPDRDELVLAAVQRCHDDLRRAVGEVPPDPGGPTGELRARLLAEAAWAGRHPGLYAVMHRSLVGRERGQPFHEASLAATAAVVGRCPDVGDEPDVGDGPGRDPLRVALDLRAAVYGAISLRIDEPGLPWPPIEEQVDHFLAAFVGG